MAALTTKPTSIENLTIHTNAFLNTTTIYLSTLSAPIEPLEELLAVSGLTNSLLQALQFTIRRFNLFFHPTNSFLNPLTQDILSNIEQLHTIVNDARSSRVWESSGVNGGGRVSWSAVCGSEENARRLRSRFFVEKYRVRVLIDAVSWFALRNIQLRSQEQEIEYQEVGKRLGTVAERLVGVWRDYTPRLKALDASQRGSGCGGERVRMDLSEMQRQRVLQLQMMNQVSVSRQSNAPPRYEAMPSSSTQSSRHFQNQTPVHAVDEKRVLNQTNTNSCGSCSSTTIPIPQDEKYETYLLRQNPSTSNLKTSTRFLGFLFSTTQSHTPATHYIKPLPSSVSEITSYRQTSLSTFSSPSKPNEETHLLNLRKRILKLPDDAQWEIQKLVENRETGTSGRNVRREWEVCAFVERPRRKINHESVKKSWWRPNRIVKNKKDKRDQVEWVLVVRGRTVDFEERNGYGTGIGGGGKEEIRVLQQKQLAAMRNQVQVLRSREQKRVLGREEAEVKMGEMCRDMFCLVEGKEEESDDDCSINEESEDEDEDMDIKD